MNEQDLPFPKWPRRVLAGLSATCLTGGGTVTTLAWLQARKPEPTLWEQTVSFVTRQPPEPGMFADPKTMMLYGAVGVMAGVIGGSMVLADDYRLLKEARRERRRVLRESRAVAAAPEI